MAEKKKNLHEKILEVMKNIEYLKKDDHVEFGTTNYKAMSEEKVTMTVRAELVKQGIVVYPIKQEVWKEPNLVVGSRIEKGNITTVNTVYRMVNVDDPTDYIELASSGQGSDSQDKGVGKAMTYAYKYLFLRTFAIPTGEDPDKISSEELDAMYKNEKDSKDYKDHVEGLKEELKSLLEKTNSDTVKFLTWASGQYARLIMSVDEMVEAELEDAIASIKAQKGAK